jgi:hypothetical protein
MLRKASPSRETLPRVGGPSSLAELLPSSVAATVTHGIKMDRHGTTTRRSECFMTEMIAVLHALWSPNRARSGTKVIPIALPRVFLAKSSGGDLRSGPAARRLDVVGDPSIVLESRALRTEE